MTTPLKRRTVYILAFALPVVGMLIMFAVNAVWPFGDNDFAISDMTVQYVPFMIEFRRKLRSGESLAYSWNLGLGDNFLPLYAYYLASPENWLIALLPESWVRGFFECFVVIKTGLCGLTMAHYLGSKSARWDTRVVMFSLFYGQSGYITAMYPCNMWLDAVVLAPLMILGIERLVACGRWRLYLFSLALCIVCNYYMGIIVCIFCVIYFLLQLFVNKLGIRDVPKVTGKFIACSLLAGGLAAVLLVPVAAAMLGTNSVGYYPFPDTWTQYFTPMEAFCRHAMGAPAMRVDWDHEPNLYCGVLVFLLLPMYLTHPQISVRRKIGYTVLLAIMMTAMTLNIPEFIWHGMSVPNGWPARESFLYILAVTSMGYEVAAGGKSSARGILYGGLLAAIWTAMSLYMGYGDRLEPVQVYTTLGAIAAYVFIYLLCPKRYAVLGSVAVLLLAFGEVTEHASVTGPAEKYAISYDNRVQYEETIAAAMSKLSATPYRVLYDGKNGDNCNLFAHSSSLSSFSSCINGRTAQFYNRLGLSGLKNEYWVTNDTPIETAMLGAGFVLTDKESPVRKTLEQPVSESDELSLYRCNENLSFGWAVSKKTAQDMEDNLINRYYTDEEISKWDTQVNIEDAETPESSSESVTDFGADVERFRRSLSVSQALSKTLTGKPLLELLPKSLQSRPTDDIETINFTIPVDGYYYLMPVRFAVGTMKCEINGRKYKPPAAGRNLLSTLGYLKMGDVVTIKHAATVIAGQTVKMPDYSGRDPEDVMSIDFYRLDEDTYNDCIVALCKQPFNVTGQGGRTLLGNVTLSDDGVLILPVINDYGWEVRVDDTKIEQNEWADCYIEIPLDAGYHEVRLIFRTRGLIVGLVITLFCTGIVMYMCRSDKRVHDRGGHHETK